MKTLKRAYIFLLIMCLASAVAFLGDGMVAEAAEAQGEVLSVTLSEGTYYYSVSDGKATIVDANVAGDITIPETLGGYPVTAIGERAFSYQKKITSVTVPGCIKTLGYESFACCSKLESVVLEEGVEAIGAYAFDCEEYLGDGYFSYASSLKNITLPDSIVEISWGAFCHTLLEGTITLPKNLKVYTNPFSATKVDTIIIPEGMKYSEDIIFVGKPKVVIDEKNDSYSIDENGFIFTEDNKVIVYSTDKDITEYVVPETVEAISPYCFAYCKKLENIVLPDILNKIGYNSFVACYALEEVTLPDSVNYIGERAFEECENLEKINLPEGITEIEYATFNRCYKLSEINLPTTLIKIDALAFAYTNISGELVVPENVREIGAFAFDNDITHLKFLSNDLTLHKQALSSCEGLIEVEFTPGDLYIDSYAFPVTKSFTKVTLPEGNVTLGDNVFRNTYINTIEINSSNVIIENITTNPDIYDYYSNFCDVGKVIIGKNVSKINVNLFNMRFIKEIILDSENPYFTISDYALYNKDMTELVRFFYPEKDGYLDYFEVPETVKIIGPQSFRRARVDLVKLNYGLEVISEYAFYEHSYLNVITIPETVTEIKKSAFGKCNPLYSVCYPKGEEEWNKISIASGSGYFTSAKKHFYHEHSMSDYVYNNNSVYGEKDGTKTAYCTNGCGLKHSPKVEGSMYILNKPENFKALFPTTNKISLYWDAKNYSPTGYRVYLYDQETGRYTKLGTTKEEVGVIRNLEPGTEYNFLVRAYKKLDDGTVVWSPYSKDDILVAGTLPEKTTGITATQSTTAIKLSWKETAGATGYCVYKYVAATGKFTELGTVKKLNGTIKNLKPGTTYAYLVRAYKQLSDGTILWADYSSDDVFYTSTRSEAPALKATSGSKKFTLSWNKVSGATNYEIWYSTSENGTYKKLATVTGTTYSKSCSSGKTYYFKVRAMKNVNGQTIKGEASIAKGIKIK